MSEDKLKFQFNALNWLLEHQLLDDPQIMNHLALNVLGISKSIKDVEFLLSRDHRQLLVYVELSWFGRVFKKDLLFEETQSVLSQMLPTFKMRIINDPKIFKMALDKVKKALTGGSSEIRNKSGIISNAGGIPGGSASQVKTNQSSNLAANIEKQSENQQELRKEAIVGDSKKINKV